MCRESRPSERRGGLWLDQSVRRSAAANSWRRQRAIAAHGLDGARLNRVADEAGLTSGAVLYYYPDIDDLVLEATRAGMERFYEQRVRMMEALDEDPVARLIALIDSGLPSDPEDIEVRLLCELGGSAGRHPVMAFVLTTLFDRQVGMYQVVLEQGAARGMFTLTQPSLTIARNLVALEDAYGYRMVAASVHRLRRRLRADPRLRARVDRASAHLTASLIADPDRRGRNGRAMRRRLCGVELDGGRTEEAHTDDVTAHQIRRPMHG